MIQSRWKSIALNCHMKAGFRLYSLLGTLRFYSEFASLDEFALTKG